MAKTKAKSKAKSKQAAKPERQARAGTRAEQSVQAFRDALEKSVHISRERLQEVVDDAVRRGRMTRGDGEELVTRVITRGREQAEDILVELERIIGQIRGEVETAAREPRKSADRAAGRARRELEDASDRARQEVGARAKRARKRAVAAVDQPLAGADRVRRRARLPGFPITAYDQLSVRQIDRRLTELTREQLRKVRTYEKRNKARKGVLRSVDRKLQK
jgi:polyhydroxyalkanoate synthesis regulator phasin